MGTYNFLRSSFTARYDRTPTGIVETFVMGALAGTVTLYATQPLDTIKTRSQSARGQGMGSAVVGVWRDGGVLAFWRGSSMRLGRLMLSGGIVFAVYEQISQLMLLA